MKVLGAAGAAGWSRSLDQFDGGQILRDFFAGPRGEIRVVWLRTPWSDSGRFAGAVFSDATTKKDRNAWSVSGKRGLLEFLAG